MKNTIMDMLTPRWLEEKLIPQVPLTEENVRPFIGMYWDFFGLDHSDPCKEALIKFLVEFGREKGREKYNLKKCEPVQWAFQAGFDKGYEAGYQKNVKAFEESNAINNAIIEENKLIIEHTRAESDRIIANVKAMLEAAGAHLDTVLRLQGLNDDEIQAIWDRAKLGPQGVGTDAELTAIKSMG